MGREFVCVCSFQYYSDYSPRLTSRLFFLPFFFCSKKVAIFGCSIDIQHSKKNNRTLCAIFPNKTNRTLHVCDSGSSSSQCVSVCGAIILMYACVCLVASTFIGSLPLHVYVLWRGR